MTPTLYIMGAGPGDPDLISVKGLKLLQRADVILYDALVSPELLAAAKPGCRTIYVGKRKGHKEFPQEEINSLLVFYARRFNCVVRLKGGDPYVFGRGHEELEFATSQGVNVQVIPGISSALAAPSAAGIPLTKRGVNESFWVITGTLSSGEISGDIQLAAQSSATVIILMGLNQLQKIASIFTQMRSPHEPVAVIEKATLADQRVVCGTAATIFDLAKENEINTPAIIVVGKVVDERGVMPSLKELQMVQHTEKGNRRA
ncbi:MAG: uroporphyrinogen-III C-methyltransferase [Marivirga sp.]|nr:uroporphyrinogen-III C-methyltransferase [Marivirga sp.]